MTDVGPDPYASPPVIPAEEAEALAVRHGLRRTGVRPGFVEYLRDLWHFRHLMWALAKGEFIFGYALAFTLVAVLQTVIAVSFALLVLGLQISGSLVLLFSVAALDALLGTSLGLMASAFARTEFQVVQFMPLLIFPQFLLSGLILPREQLPGTLEVIGDWLPLSHAIDALGDVAAGTEDSGTWASLLVIGAWILGALLVGSLTLRRRTP